MRWLINGVLLLPFVAGSVGVAVEDRRATDWGIEGPAVGHAPDVRRRQQRNEATLRRVDSLWARMYAQHDTVTASRLYADGLVFQSANGRRKTKAEEMGDVRPAPGLVMEFFRTEPTSVRATADSGHVAGVASWRFTMNGQPREVRRTYEATYARGGALGWQIVFVRMGSAP